MKREKLKDMYQWLGNPRRKPLVIWGARQVGKTYLVKELFAKEAFEDYIYIDLKKDTRARQFFSTTSNPKDYISFLDASVGKRPSESIPLILDEIQQCHQAISALKYFKQDYPSIPVVATGSMVRLSLKHYQRKKASAPQEDEFLFPVGAINSLNLYPLTFDEFLLNTNPVLLDIIRNAFNACLPLATHEHALALDALYTFLAIGGLPEALDTFISTGSFSEAKAVLRDVYDNYLADMDTYNVSTETILKTRRVYQNIYGQLNKENKNFKVSQVESGKSNRDYFNAYQWLELARVVYRSNKLQGKVNFPLQDGQSGLFRLYLSDPGMFTYQSGITQAEFMVNDGRNSLAGIFYESYVADELRAKDLPLFYWTGKGAHEFEFVVEHAGKAVPVDVKKGKGKLNSLNEFRLSNPHSTAIKVHVGNIGYDSKQDILSIPLYAVFALAQCLAQESALPIPNSN